MSIRKVDTDHEGYTYSSYVVAGDFIFSSIRSGSGETLREQARNTIIVDQFLGDSILFQIDAIAYKPQRDKA